MRHYAILILSIMVMVCLSGCDIYDQLANATTEQVEYVPIGDIKVEEEIDQVPGDQNMTEVGEEAMTAEDTTEKTIEDEQEASEAGQGTEETTEDETVQEETPQEETDSKVIFAEETELIQLSPVAEDPDADALSYSYTSPLNDQGNWQTAYGDAGEYTVTITASDGELSASEQILIVVNKKEEPPVIDSFSPQEDTLSMKENSNVEFSVSVSDLNGDDISYQWKLDGNNVGQGDAFAYETDFASQGSHTIKMDATDGTETASLIWAVEVENVNRPPVLEHIDDIAVKETETVTIEPVATDPDDDDITISISDPVGDDGVWQTSYDDAGEYEITITATDGTDTVSQVVKVTVENVNRPPVIIDIVKR